ncbi:MAG: hypothetical protein ABI663_21090 [Chryseolinea sp.]
MKKTRALILLVIAFAIHFSVAAQLTNFQSKKYASSAGYYLEYLPPDYNDAANANKKYPVIIFLHGQGKIASCGGTPACNNYDELNKVLTEGLPKEIISANSMCFNGECFIVISPQLKNGNSYADWTTAPVEKWIKYVLDKNNYRVDRNRVYLTGLSLGGRGTYNYAVSTRFFADSLAAIAPTAGVPSGPSTGQYCLLASRDIPVWSFHGKLDTTMPFSTDNNFIANLRNCAPTPDPGPRFTIFNNEGHSSVVWTDPYKTDNTIMNYKLDDGLYPTENLYSWFMKNEKGGNKSPNVNAGIDTTIVLPTNTINLVGSAKDFGTLTYQWTKVSGGNAVLTNANSSTLTLTALEVGTYVFNLSATDPWGAAGSDQVTVIVMPGNANTKPIADAGPDKPNQLTTDVVTLIGSATDSDGTIASYQWTKVSGPTAALSGETTSVLTLSGLAVGTYVFSLTATDNQGATSDPDEVIVTVANPQVGGNWLEFTATNAAGKSVGLYYDAQKSHAVQKHVRDGGNNYLHFYLKTISGTPNWNSLKIELVASYKTRSLVVGSYVTSVSSSWTEVQIPLDDFLFDASNWASGVSLVNFKTTSGFGVVVFGVDEIQFTGGTTPFVWYGDAYDVSGSPAAVSESSTIFNITHRYTTDGAIVSAPSGLNIQSSALRSSSASATELNEGDVVYIYNKEGQLQKKVIITATSNSNVLAELITQPGFYIFNVVKPSGDIKTIKISKEK